MKSPSRFCLALLCVATGAALACSGADEEESASGKGSGNEQAKTQTAPGQSPANQALERQRLAREEAYSAASREFREQIDQAIIAEDDETRADLLRKLSVLQIDHGRETEAVDNLQIARKIEQEQGLETGLGKTLGNLAVLHGKRGQYADAEKLFREAVSIHDKLGMTEDLAKDYQNLSMLYNLMNQTVKAQEYWNKSQDLMGAGAAITLTSPPGTAPAPAAAPPEPAAPTTEP